MRDPRRRAVLALSLLLPVPSLGTAAAMFWWPGTLLGQGLYVASRLWTLALPVAWLLVVERNRLGWSPARRGGFGMAVATGAAMAAVVVMVHGATSALGWLDPDLVAARARQTGLSDLRLFLVGAAYWITLNALLEEYVWRWFCFRQCEVLFGGAGGVLAAGVGFTLHHVVALSGQTSWPLVLAGSFGVLAAGVTWGWLFLRYRSVWPCYVSHVVVDVPIFAIGYWLIFG